MRNNVKPPVFWTKLFPHFFSFLKRREILLFLFAKILKVVYSPKNCLHHFARILFNFVQFFFESYTVEI